MYWASPLLAKVVTLGLLEPRTLARLDSKWGTADTVETTLVAEVEAWSRLNDPKVVTVERVERASDSIALVSRWVDGTSLAELVRAGRRLSPDAAMTLARQLVAALG